MQSSIMIIGGEQAWQKKVRKNSLRSQRNRQQAIRSQNRSKTRDRLMVNIRAGTASGVGANPCPAIAPRGVGHDAELNIFNKIPLPPLAPHLIFPYVGLADNVGVLGSNTIFILDFLVSNPIQTSSLSSMEASPVGVQNYSLAVHSPPLISITARHYAATGLDFCRDLLVPPSPLPAAALLDHLLLRRAQDRHSSKCGDSDNADFLETVFHHFGRVLLRPPVSPNDLLEERLQKGVKGIRVFAPWMPASYTTGFAMIDGGAA